MPEPNKTRGYVVAVRQKEADEIARDRPEIVHYTKASASKHLAEVKAPPTDPFYGNKYRIYRVWFDEARAAEIVKAGLHRDCAGRSGERRL